MNLGWRAHFDEIQKVCCKFFPLKKLISSKLNSLHLQMLNKNSISIALVAFFKQFKE